MRSREFWSEDIWQQRVTVCIFCSSPLTKNTKPEHILLSAFGGRKTTRRVICSACNNTFGQGIDKTLASQFAGLRNMLRLYSGTGRAPPAIRNVTAGEDRISIDGDGAIRTLTKPFTITDTPDGPKQLSISADSFEAIAQMIPHMAAALKIPEERLRELISQQQGTIVERRPDPICLQLRFGGLDAIRSAAKSCLVLWATLVGNQEIMRRPYDHVRQFVLGQRPDFPGERTDLDSRFFPLPETVLAEYGPAFNLLYVKSDGSGRVIGHFTMYNIVGVSIVLAPDGGTPDRQVALISNPITHAWSDKIASELDTPIEWLGSPDYDYESMDRSKERISRIMEYYVRTSRDREIRRIIKSTLKNHGLKEGDRIPGELALSISREISQRITCHLFNIPFKKKLAAEQLRELLQPEGVEGK